jgi:hypothetical protein
VCVIISQPKRLPFEGRGHRFESCRARHFRTKKRTAPRMHSLIVIAALPSDTAAAHLIESDQDEAPYQREARGEQKDKVQRVAQRREGDDRKSGAGVEQVDERRRSASRRNRRTPPSAPQSLQPRVRAALTATASIGLDIAKNVFQLHGVAANDPPSKPVRSRRLPEVHRRNVAGTALLIITRGALGYFFNSLRTRRFAALVSRRF